MAGGVGVGDIRVTKNLGPACLQNIGCEASSVIGKHNVFSNLNWSPPDTEEQQEFPANFWNLLSPLLGHIDAERGWT